MKNRFHLLATAVVSLLCVSCAETQVSQSGSEKAVNPPIMGWSSWNAFRVDISEDIIKNQADLMVKKGLKDAGYHYINIDDGFFGERDGNGKMQTNKNRFPNGMKPVAAHIHSLGMKAGIYTDAGNNTCGSIWDNDHAGVGAGIYGHEQQDAQLYFGDWGFDFIKIDYCGGDVLGLNEQERYTSIRNSIDKVNKDVSVNICRWAFPGTWAKDVATSWRISGDINAHWGSLRYVVGKNLYLSAYAKDGYYNDMDMMVVGMRGKGNVGLEGLNDDQYLLHFSVWALLGSPLFIGCDLREIDDATLNILKNKEVIAINQDAGCRQVMELHPLWAPQIKAYARYLENGDIAVGFFNLSEKEQLLRYEFEELGVQESTGKTLMLHDVWSGEEFRLENCSVWRNMKPYETLLFRCRVIDK